MIPTRIFQFAHDGRSIPERCQSCTESVRYFATVTVLMPVYNAGAHLRAAVESILLQTHSDFELLIVDDGSTDGSADVLEDLAGHDARIRLVCGPHEGVASALNRGLALARGSVIVRMDADDIARPERIERQLAYLGEHPEVAVVGSAIDLIDREGRERRSATYPVTPDEVRRCFEMGGSALAHPAVAMRRDAVLAIGGYRPLFEAAEDFDLWLRLLERHELANLPDALLDFRCHGQNVSNRHRRQQCLAYFVARLAARERGLGRPDPTIGLDRLGVSDLDRFEQPPGERDSFLFALSEAGLQSYEATGATACLADIEETLRMHGYAPHPARARRIARRLVRYSWTAGDRRRSVSALVWMARCEASVALAWLRSVRVRAWHRLRSASAVRRLETAAHRMAAARRARASGTLVADWLVHCADPLGPRTAPPPRMLTPQEAMELVAQADVHGVLGAVLRNFPPFSRDPGYSEARQQAVSWHRSALVQSLMLRTCGEGLLAEAAGLPVVVVKGPAFARTIYPSPALRSFTDIDLLAAPEAEPELARLLDEEGFRLAEHEHGRQEWKWLHRDNAALMVEVHTNLVHQARLRGPMSVTHADLAGIAETPAALLAVAAIHGALHRFERLCHVVDICQAARHLASADEESRFVALIRRTGGRLAAIAGLDLAWRLFGEPRCREIAAALRPGPYAALSRLLIDRSVVTSTMTGRRFYSSWRRQGFRVLLTRYGAS